MVLVVVVVIVVLLVVVVIVWLPEALGAGDSFLSPGSFVHHGLRCADSGLALLASTCRARARPFSEKTLVVAGGLSATARKTTIQPKQTKTKIPHKISKQVVVVIIMVVIVIVVVVVTFSEVPRGLFH